MSTRPRHKAVRLILGGRGEREEEPRPVSGEKKGKFCESLLPIREREKKGGFSSSTSDKLLSFGGRTA